MATMTVSIQISTLITLITYTGSDNLTEKKGTEQFKWSLNCRFKAGCHLFSIAFVQVSPDGLPSDIEKRCRFFGDWFLRGTMAFHAS